MPGKLTEKNGANKSSFCALSQILCFCRRLPSALPLFTIVLKDREIGGQGEGQRVRPQHVLDQRPRGAKGVLLRRPVRDSKAEGGEHRDRRCRVRTPFCFFLEQLLPSGQRELENHTMLRPMNR